MHGRTEQLARPTIAYDAGGWFVYVVLLGLPAVVGLVLDYFWNYLVLSLALRWVHRWADSLRKHTFCLIVTPIGLLIDWGYWLLIRDEGYLSPRQASWNPETPPGIRVAAILIPMALLILEYAVLFRLYLRLHSKPAMLAGVLMGVLTSPWAILGYFLLRAFV